MNFELSEVLWRAQNVLVGLCAAVGVGAAFLWQPTARRVRASGAAAPLVWLTLASTIAFCQFLFSEGLSQFRIHLQSAGAVRPTPGYLLLYAITVFFAAAGLTSRVMAARSLFRLPPGSVRPDGHGSGGRSARRVPWVLRQRPAVLGAVVCVVFGMSSSIFFLGLWFGDWRPPMAWNRVAAGLPLTAVQVATDFALASALSHAFGRPRRGGLALLPVWYRAQSVIEAALDVGGRTWWALRGEPPWWVWTIDSVLWTVHAVELLTLVVFVSHVLESERTARLAAEAAQRRLEGAAEALGGVFSFLRHTLRGKVGLLEVHATMLSASLDDDDLDGARESAAAFTRELNVLQVSVIPLLTASSTSGPIRDAPAHDLDGVIATWASWQTGRARVEYVRAASPVLARIDPVTLHSVLDRLYENAVGHGRATHLRVRVERTPQAALIQVTNDGEPIAPHARPTLFLDPTHGLGAAFVLLAREGARIALGDGGGAEFWVTVPVDAEPPPNLPAPG